MNDHVDYQFCLQLCAAIITQAKADIHMREACEIRGHHVNYCAQEFMDKVEFELALIPSVDADDVALAVMEAIE